VEFGVALVADSEAAEVVQVREAALDDPALATQAGAVRCAAAGDHGLDPTGPQQPAVLVVVIAAIGEQQVGFLAWPADLPGDRPGVQIVEQRQQLGDVVAVGAGQRDGQRDAGRVDQQMMF
jgi:hypothetical protein